MLVFVHQMLLNSNEEANNFCVFESICVGLRGNSKILLQGDAGKLPWECEFLIQMREQSMSQNKRLEIC